MIVTSELRFAIFAAFKERGIRIPFPRRDVHMQLEDGEVAKSDVLALYEHSQGSPLFMVTLAIAIDTAPSRWTPISWTAGYKSAAPRPLREAVQSRILH